MDTRTKGWRKSTQKTVAVLTLFVAALSAAPALARPDRSSGEITSKILFSEMTVNRDGSLSFALHNRSASDATFGGAVQFTNDEGARAWSAPLSALRIPAGESIRVTTHLEKGSWADVAEAGTIVWSGVRVDNDAETGIPVSEVEWTVLN